MILIKHGWNKNNNVSIQHIKFYELSETTGSIINYSLKLILNSLQELINNVLNLQIMYPIARNKKLSDFYNGHRKTKIETIPGSKYSY